MPFAAPRNRWSLRRTRFSNLGREHPYGLRKRRAIIELNRLDATLGRLACDPPVTSAYHLSQFDGGVVARGGSDPAIAGEQNGVEHLRERHIHCIIGS